MSVWRPREDLKHNTPECERIPFVLRHGFREYDARWRYPDEINLLGFQCVGAAVGTQLRRMGHSHPMVVVGHDYRAYSMALKNALTVGLLSSGCAVHDIGLAITPMAYFARTFLGIPSIAMVTASHNENGWTGLKVGAEPPLTFGPDEIAQLRETVFRGDYDSLNGSYTYHPNLLDEYVNSLIKGPRLKRQLRVVVACGNGTAGLFAPRVLEGIGCEVIPLHCSLDWNFPNYNPNPEDLTMLQSVQEKVASSQADLGLAFDGDGDRLGVVDDKGEELFSDKLGLLIARRLCKRFPGARFVVDVKSTGLFSNDPVLKQHGAEAEFWVTGHSYIKRRMWETRALAGFEKSGHFFFSEPVGHGYDDALLSAVLLCRMLDEEESSLSTWRRELPITWQSPTMAPFCPEEEKYKTVANLRAEYESIAKKGGSVCGQKIRELVTVNGVRVILEDGTWGLVRASSNKPSLVVVVESPTSEVHMRALFTDLDERLRRAGPVGAYDQTIDFHSCSNDTQR